MLMKRQFNLILLALLTSGLCAQKIAEYKDLEQIEGVYYEKSTFERFTGTIRDTTRTTNDFMQLQLVDGIPHGLFEGFYDEERTVLKWKVNFVNGKRDGYYVSFFENGLVEFIVHLRADKMEGKRWCYYKTGELMHVHSYRNGIEDGMTNTYHVNGQLLERVSYKKGLKNGEFCKYHQNGALMQKGRFRNNNPVGVIRQYDKSGKFEAKEKYKNGKRVGRRFVQ